VPPPLAAGHPGVPSSPTLSSAVSGMLLDTNAAEGDGPGGGWVHHFISGCSTALALPPNGSSSWGGCGGGAGSDSLAAEPSGGVPPPLQQQYNGVCDFSQPGWGLVTPAVLQGSMAAAPKALSGGGGGWSGLGGAKHRQLWGAGSEGHGRGSAEAGLLNLGGDHWAGFEDGQPLSAGLLAASQLATPPVPPKGSKFDDMDCFSSSLHKSAAAIAAAAVAGELAARKEQQQQQLAHWKQQQKQRSLPHQLLLQLGLPAGTVNSSTAAVEDANAARRASLDFSSLTRPLSGSKRSQQQQSPRPVGNLLLMLNGHLADSSSPGPAAAAAAAAISAQLESLIGGLSLLGERDASAVGHELAVAESIHDVCLQHHRRYSSYGRSSGEDGGHTSRLSFGGGSAAATAAGSGGDGRGGVVSHSSSSDSLRTRQQHERGSNSGGWQQQLRKLLRSVAAAAGQLGSTAAAALANASAAAAGSSGGSNAAQRRLLAAGASSDSSAAAARANSSSNGGPVRRVRSQGPAGVQSSGRGGGLWQFPSPQTAAGGGGGGHKLRRATTTGTRDTAAVARAAAVAAAAATAAGAGERSGGGQLQGQNAKRQGLGPTNRRWL
jgi:hypothetical protein